MASWFTLKYMFCMLITERVHSNLHSARLAPAVGMSCIVSQAHKCGVEASAVKLVLPGGSPWLSVLLISVGRCGWFGPGLWPADVDGLALDCGWPVWMDWPWIVAGRCGWIGPGLWRAGVDGLALDCGGPVRMDWPWIVAGRCGWIGPGLRLAGADGLALD